MSVQNPITLNPFSEPEPDITLVRNRADTYTLSHPVPADVHLIVEVAETSLTTARTIKIPAYAEAGIPEVWVIDVVDRNVYVYRSLAGGSYRDTPKVSEGDSVSPTAFTDVAVSLSDLFR